MTEDKQCRVYSRFTATGRDGSTVKLKIQDMPAESQETVMDLFVNTYVKEEAVYKASGVYKNEDSRVEILKIFLQMTTLLEPHIVVCCLDDGSDAIGQITGASMMYLAEGIMDLSKFQVETKEVKKLFEIGVNALYRYDVVKEYKVDKYYEDLGIVVHPDFRQMGIAKEFVKTRRVICKLNQVSVTAAWMTAIGTQKAGESDNWETVYELAFDDLSKKFDVVFEDTPPTCKYMVAKVVE